MTLSDSDGRDTTGSPATGLTITQQCRELTTARTRGELGEAIARIVLLFSPADIQRMRRNFYEKIRTVNPEYRDRLEKKVTEHLLGTYQSIRLMKQQGVFKTMLEPVTDLQKKYWHMAGEQCTAAQGDESRLRFLKFLLAGFCMLVRHEPGHPVGMPFPGGDTVEYREGVYYCPVRDKANDVDAALCPFCPALQTPEIGYLRPPVDGSEHRKQEFIDNCYRYHNFNG